MKLKEESRAKKTKFRHYWDSSACACLSTSLALWSWWIIFLLFSFEWQCSRWSHATYDESLSLATHCKACQVFGSLLAGDAVVVLIPNASQSWCQFHFIAWFKFCSHYFWYTISMAFQVVLNFYSIQTYCHIFLRLFSLFHFIGSNCWWNHICDQ